jgi:hypothetical protein
MFGKVCRQTIPWQITRRPGSGQAVHRKKDNGATRYGRQTYENNMRNAPKGLDHGEHAWLSGMDILLA